jgi:uncharacterized RDD family membrane protein YckC
MSLVRTDTALVNSRDCGNCGRTWGSGQLCRWCGQVEGLPIGVAASSVGRRLGGNVLDTLLAIVTLGIGWLIWALIVAKDGQTPAKQILGMKAFVLDTGLPAGWGRTFVREFIAKTIIGTMLGWLVFPYFWLCWDSERQELWDKIVGTIVVNVPKGMTIR